MKNYTLILMLTFLFTQALTANNENKKRESFTINQKSQKVEFFIDDDNVMKAKLSTELEVQLNSNLNNTYANSIFANDFSRITNLQYKIGKGLWDQDIVLSDYDIDGIFSSDTKVCYFDHVFDEKGEVVTFIYEVVFDDIKFLNKIFFGDAYKVLESNVTIEVPEWMDAGIFKWNFENSNITSDIVKKGGTKIYNYKETLLDPLVIYKNEPSVSLSRPHLVIIPRSFSNNGKEVRLMQETSDLYNWYNSLTNGDENKPEELNDLVNKLVKESDSDTDKIKTIFYWVQDNIRYLAYEDGIMGFKPQTCQEVYANKYGDCKGMANLTKNLLVLAGLDARLTWLGTKDLPYSYATPSLMVDNHMICTVFLDGKEIFLDATEKYSDLRTYAYRIEGKEVMIEDGDNFLLKEVPVADLSLNKETYHYHLDIEDDKLLGTGNMQVTGTRKTWLFNFMHYYKNSDRQDALTNYITNDDKNLSIKLGETVDLNRDRKFTHDYSIELKNQITKLADEMYLSLEFDNTYQNYTIQKNRKRPVSMNKTYFLEALTELNIPEGASISYMPEPVKVATEKYEFDLSYNQQGNTIIYNKTIKIKTPIINPDEFEDWNKAIKALNKFYSDQIIIINKKS